MQPRLRDATGISLWLTGSLVDITEKLIKDRMGVCSIIVSNQNEKSNVLCPVSSHDSRYLCFLTKHRTNTLHKSTRHLNYFRTIKSISYHKYPRLHSFRPKIFSCDCKGEEREGLVDRKTVPLSVMAFAGHSGG